MIFASVLALLPGATLQGSQSQGNPPPRHVATTPADRNGEDWWRQRHERCVEITNANAFQVAFLGDSITQGWEGAGRDAWLQNFTPLGAANFGFSGDRTEHAIWRLEHGEITGTNVKVIVIMLGTNNVGHGSSDPQQTIDGMKSIIGHLLVGTKAKILLLGVFPRGADTDDRLRKAVAEVTEGYAKLHDGKRVFFTDVGHHLVRPDGTLRSTLMPDLLHLNQGGYEIWAKALLPELKKLLEG